MKEKEITIVGCHYNNRHEWTEYTGTLEELCTKVFGFTLERGNICNKMIPRQPKSAWELVKALNNTARTGNRFIDYYFLKKA